MIRMSTKQKIILRKYRDGDSERKIARELKVNRTTVRRYLNEYKRAREELLCSDPNDESLIDNLVKPPTYNSTNRDKKKYTEEIDKEIDRLREALSHLLNSYEQTPNIISHLI